MLLSYKTQRLETQHESTRTSCVVDIRLLFIHRRLPPTSTYYCLSTLDFLQPPPATVHPPSTSSSLLQPLFIHGLLFIQPPPTTVQPTSTGSYSSNPSPNRLGCVAASSGSCSSSGNDLLPWGPIHPTPLGTFHPHSTNRLGQLTMSRLVLRSARSSNVHSSSRGNPTGYVSHGGSIDRL